MPAMRTKDAGSLAPAAQEELRRRAVRAVRDGMTQTAVAKMLHVSRVAVNNWCRQHEEAGAKALRARKRGRPRGSQLTVEQRRQTIRWITSKCPDQMLLPFALWTREAVQQLFARKFDLALSVWTVGRYLKAWGFTPQKPLRRAFEQDPAAIQRWLDTDYPAIAAEAKRLGAQIHWGDEMGMRSDHQAGRSYGRRGQTPVIPGTGQRFRCNMISTITNRGKLAFMVFDEEFNAAVFLRFLKRLLRLVKRRIILIVDRHPVHRSADVKRWLAQQKRRIKMFFLPSYSPELNPDELLNQDVKSNAVGRNRPHTKAELLDNVRGFLRSTQRQPAIVMNYFKEAHVRYAAV